MGIVLIITIQFILFAVIWKRLRYLEDSINFTNTILSINRAEFLRLKHKLETEKQKQ